MDRQQAFADAYRIVATHSNMEPEDAGPLIDAIADAITDSSPPPAALPAQDVVRTKAAERIRKLEGDGTEIMAGVPTKEDLAEYERLAFEHLPPWARERITSQAARIEQLEKERESWRRVSERLEAERAAVETGLSQEITSREAAEATISRQAAALSKARGALEPFAKRPDDWTVEDVNRAALTLKELEADNG